MRPESTVSQLWNQPLAPAQVSTGVSLHSHTSLSLETLSFIHNLGRTLPFIDRLTRHYGRRSSERHGITLDFEAAHWRPPLVPRMAWDLESRQIEQLGLRPLVSITDHDCMQAPLLLRTIPEVRHIPVSLEWTAPFGSTCFHLGIHNLPSASALDWMSRLAHFTANPSEPALTLLLEELDSLPDVLVVLNHPAWDLYRIGDDHHAAELDRFLHRFNHRLHAFELNGLRHARENREVVALARRWQQLLISGGDRHGLEPNANINLTASSTFQQFVHEIRDDRRSHVLFLPQYRRRWEQRILQSTIEAISDHPQFGPGWQRWDERAFHPAADGSMRSLAELWPGGRAPLVFRAAIHLTRMLSLRPINELLANLPGSTLGDYEVHHLPS